jgi:hypothetical protein
MTFFAKVVFPEPEPPAIPIRKILFIRVRFLTKNEAQG